MITKKIVLIGDFATGKTSLIRRYVDNQFSDEYLTTIGVKISKKHLALPQDIELQLMIWDIEGRTDVKDTNPSYIMGAHGVVIVGDISREVSLENIPIHIDFVRSLVPNAPIIVALNKSDLIRNGAMVEHKVLAFKDSLYEVVDVLDTSAKDAKNVDEIFIELSKAILEKR